MIQYFKQRFWDMEWAVAIRPHKAEGLFDTPMEFRVLKNTWRYWCADPFVFEHEGKTYVFMEVLDRIIQRGAIGYRVIEDGKAGPIRVCIRTPYHMSYPMIYTRGEDILMIPECHESRKMTVYRAVSFPDEWEPVETILDGQMVCDTNHLTHQGREYLLTMPIHGIPYCYDTLELFCRNEAGEWSKCPVGPRVIGAESARNGGHFLKYQGELIRPGQNCGSSYGEKLVINRVKELSPECYREEIWKEISVRDIRTDRGHFDGIHTFNCSESYDVIDLRMESRFQPLKLIYLIRSKTRRKNSHE